MKLVCRRFPWAKKNPREAGCQEGDEKGNENDFPFSEVIVS
jgi:hypothetical protein